MADHYTISFVGCGNVAWHLAPELENAGHKVLEIYNRSTAHARSMQSRLYNAEIRTNLDFSESEADIIFITVSDDAISEVAQEMALQEDVVVVHTSGSSGLRQLGYLATENIGVFYPLQTFTREKKIRFQDIPILIEGENKKTTKILMSLASSVSNEVHQVNSKDRLAIHVAAVFACNFSNYLFRISEDILKKEGFKLDLLRPLIAETLNKSLEIGPEKAQTGPAAREDLETLDRHMAFLKDPVMRKFYKLFSEEILKNKK